MAACFLVIDLFEECTDYESGEIWWKGEWIRECIKKRNKSGMINLVKELRVEDTAANSEMFRMNFETFKELLTTIRPVFTKTADRRTIMNYHMRGHVRKTIFDYHEEFEQAQNE